MSEDNLQEPLLERLSASPEPIGAAPSKKRKRTGKDMIAPKEKKAKNKKKKDEEEDAELDFALGLNMAFSHMDNQLLADYISQKTWKFESDLSSVELEDRYLKAGNFTESIAFDKPRTLDNLPAFLEKFSLNPTKLWGSSKKNGSPHTIIICSSGLRCADVARTVRKFAAQGSHVAKLFGKEKVDALTKFMQSHRTGIAIGTPMRLSALTENGAMSIDRLERIVVDASSIDVKKRGILEMKETQVPLVQWLNNSNLKERYGAAKDGVDLLIY